VRPGAVSFEGDGVTTILGIHDERVFSYHYAFGPADGAGEQPLPVEDRLRELWQGELLDPPASGGCAAEVTTRPQTFLVVYGRHEFTVDRATGNLSVYRDGHLVHGGPMGTADTVLPAEQLRVQQLADGSLGPAKFNFRLAPADRFFGLGEKSGPLNRRSRRFKMFNRDALGYSARYSDPLYKSVPFFLKDNPQEGGGGGPVVGILFAHSDVDEVDFGVESGFYYFVRVNRGPYGYFLFTGDGYRDCLEGFTRVVGRPALPPLFSFGFLGSSMSYTDPDNAEEKVKEFFDRVEEYGVPCEGMYFSSGYSRTDDGQRHALVWNRTKFPDPDAMVSGLRERGYRIACNIKPGFLVSHPWYDELSQRGFFVQDASGAAYREYYWGNSASLLDFLNADARSWWQDAVQREFIGRGIAGIWNDNNEFEIEDASVPRWSERPALALGMVKAAHDAVRAAHPGKRPWIITRAGSTGIQCYARTWTGDNTTNWESLKFNTYMGLNLGLSGIPFFGHDIGGFFGPAPDEHLLRRWCQTAVFQPRFVVHSWNDDGEATELWNYPDASEDLYELVRLHYHFMPYLYNVAVTAHLSGTPMHRPLALEFPRDQELDTEDVNFLVGDSILALSPVEADADNVDVSLPRETVWYDPENRQQLQGGGTRTLSFPADGFRYLVRLPGIVPTAPGLSDLRTGFFPSVTFELYPGADVGDLTRFRYYEDDGESDYRTGPHGEYEVVLQNTGWDGAAMRVRLDVEPVVTEHEVPRHFIFRLPPGFAFASDTLRVEAGGGSSAETRILPGGELEIGFTGTCPAVHAELEGHYAQ
jgi:alpha-glucosidase